jgi:PAS domain S-box-containing protein
MDSQTLHSLLNLTQDIIVVIDEERTYLYANAATKRILGYDQETVVGKNPFEFIHEEDRPAVRSLFEQLVEGNEERTETIAYRHRSADGSWVWLESRMWNRVNTELGGYVVSSRDITAQKNAEKRRRETETQLRQIAANTEDVLWMFSADWEELLFVNEAYEELWGMSREELAADPARFIDGVHPEDRSRVRRAMDQLASGEQIDMEYRVNSDHSFPRWVWARGYPVEENGEVTKVVGFVRDVTNRRRRERQLQVLDNLLRHNLRNTMNIVFGNADLARQHGDEDTESWMDAIIESGSELLDTVEKERQIVDTLVDVGEPRPIELQAILDEAITEARDRHPEVTIEIERTDTVGVLAVPELKGAICELIENGIEHACCPPTLELRVDTRPEAVSIQVQDNAPPIPGNEIEPLFAEANPSTVYHGTGLGLWLVYWIVDICDGTVGFGRSADNAGNVVTIRLPRA